MDVEEMFISVSGLICEPTRAKMLWNLLDGRAYTASELAIVADISATAASNHLAKLLDADIIKVEVQGRHRYYSFSKPEVAYVIESLANLAADKNRDKPAIKSPGTGIKFCRTCYDHLAGHIGVKVAEKMEEHKYLIKTAGAYQVTEKGWRWFGKLGICKEEFNNTRRPLTRQCLDWSERRPHLAGQLGAIFLGKMLQDKWFKRVQFSRELAITAKGREALYRLLGISA